MEVVYDDSLRVVKETYFDSNDIEMDEIQYSYDADGNRLTVSGGSAEGTYIYDHIHQLVGITTATGDETYTYDAGGRIASITRDGSTWNLEYNSADLITRITDAEGNVIVEYEYDSSGRRVGATDSTASRDYLVAPMGNSDLESPHLVTDENGNLISAYIYGGAMPLMRLDGSGNPVYYLTDAVGSVIGLADVSGIEVADFRYDSFGNLRSSTGVEGDREELAGGDFRFQGQWLSSRTDLYHFRARDYDPESGRFVSRDSVELIEYEPESSNPYQFVYNNPYVYSDPTGMFTLVELNAGYATEQALNSVQLHITNYARQYLIDKAKGVATDIITGVAKNIFTNLATLDPRLAAVVQQTPLSRNQVNRLGGGWENLIKGQFKEFIGEFIPDYFDSIWFEPEVSINGSPISDGINIGQWSIDLRNNGQKNPNPDFIIKKDGGPASTDFARGNGDKSYLIGDFKFSWNRIRKDSSKPQFKATANYAAFSNRHQVVPIVLYITMIGGHPRDLHRTTQKGIENHAVYPQYLTLFPNIRGVRQS